jgi:hypothetical protein
MSTHDPFLRTQIQLTAEQLQALKDVSAAEKTSVAELVRSGVESVLKDRSGVDRWARAAAVSGRFRSRRRDLARRHDSHLAEAFSGR